MSTDDLHYRPLPLQVFFVYPHFLHRVYPLASASSTVVERGDRIDPQRCFVCQHLPVFGTQQAAAVGGGGAGVGAGGGAGVGA